MGLPLLILMSLSTQPSPALGGKPDPDPAYRIYDGNLSMVSFIVSIFCFCGCIQVVYLDLHHGSGGVAV